MIKSRPFISSTLCSICIDYCSFNVLIMTSPAVRPCSQQLILKPCCCLTLMPNLNSICATVQMSLLLVMMLSAQLQKPQILITIAEADRCSCICLCMSRGKAQALINNLIRFRERHTFFSSSSFSDTNILTRISSSIQCLNRQGQYQVNICNVCACAVQIFIEIHNKAEQQLKA